MYTGHVGPTNREQSTDRSSQVSVNAGRGEVDLVGWHTVLHVSAKLKTFVHNDRAGVSSDSEQADIASRSLASFSSRNGVKRNGETLSFLLTCSINSTDHSLDHYLL